jgi:hypothetical protein
LFYPLHQPAVGFAYSGSVANVIEKKNQSLERNTRRELCEM